MPTSASNSGRGQKISLSTCLPSNRRSWRHEEAYYRLKHNSRVRYFSFLSVSTFMHTRWPLLQYRSIVRGERGTPASRKRREAASAPSVYLDGSNSSRDIS